MSKIVFGLYALVMSAVVVFVLGVVIGVETNQEWARELVISFVEIAE